MSAATGRTRLAETAAWLALGALVALGLPLFACMPLWTDVAFFDTVVRTMGRKGLTYPDVLLLWPPAGFFLVSKIAHDVVGWRSEALRLVDFLVVSAVVTLLVTLPHARGLSRRAAVWTASVLVFFYFSTTEFCHGQPDTWMLVPALAALGLREAQASSLAGAGGVGAGRVAARAFAEGVCWAVAFAIKPHAALAGPPCLALSAAMAHRRGRPARVLGLDAAGAALGSVAVGVGLVVWVRASGNWPAFARSFADVSAWGGEYSSKAPGWAQRTAFTFGWSMPWSLAHAAALPMSVASIASAVSRVGASAPRAIFSVFYLVFLFQANFLQYQFPYHVAPAVMLAVVLVATHDWSRVPRAFRRASVAVLLVAATAPHPEYAPHLPGGTSWVVTPHPLARPARLALWARCWREGSTPEMRDLLTLEHHQAAPDWRELARVASYLRANGLREGELTCYSASVLSLYNELDVSPSTRYVMLSAFLSMFPSHRSEILDALDASPQRFVVGDLCDHGVTIEQARAIGTIPDVMRHGFPYSYPVVFRAGRFLVHDAAGHRLKAKARRE